MDIKQSDASWIVRQSVEIWSWTGISWFVALFAGGWGVAIGIGAFLPAYICLAICLLLCAAKWCHLTNIFNAQRRVEAFAFGVLLLVFSAVAMSWWSHERSIKSDEEAKKLEPLKQIPELVSKANEIPGLKKQLESLPAMQAKIDSLTADNKQANGESKAKQQVIEGLAQTVLSQQKTIAVEAHKDIQTTQAVLTKDIDQYRSDTATAVGRIMRPGRTIGDRPKLLSILKQVGTHEIAITPAHGSQEAIHYATELVSVFTEAGWKVVPTQKFVFMITDGIGLRLVTDKFPDAKEGEIISWNRLTAGQAAAGQALIGSGIDLKNNPMDKASEGPTELYVGLQ
jgi:hypothetical protein